MNDTTKLSEEARSLFERVAVAIKVPDLSRDEIMEATELSKKLQKVISSHDTPLTVIVASIALSMSLASAVALSGPHKKIADRIVYMGQEGGLLLSTMAVVSRCFAILNMSEVTKYEQ